MAKISQMPASTSAFAAAFQLELIHRAMPCQIDPCKRGDRPISSDVRIDNITTTE